MGASMPCRHRILLSWLKYLERTDQILVDGHHGTSVIELPAVIRCREHCDELSLCKKLIAVLDYLMSATDEIQIVLLEEAADDLLTK